MMELKYGPIKHWNIAITEKKPEIFCISGAYIEQLLRRLFKNHGTDYDLLNLNGSWDNHHHGHGCFHRTQVKLRGVTHTKEDISMLQKGLRFRKEKNGLIITNGSYSYFVNTKGVDFIHYFKNGLAIGDINSKICASLKITEEEGKTFFQKLTIFGILGGLYGSNN